MHRPRSAGFLLMASAWAFPFMAMLGAKFPQVQFLITGVACVADVLAAHASSPESG